jgi:opine dehydrogenase
MVEWSHLMVRQNAREETLMDATRITVLGGGNTAFSLAANFALAGSEVVLWEHPVQAETIAPIRETRTIHLEGTEQTGIAVLAGVTTDPAEALAGSDVVLMSVPAYAHQPFVEQIVPHLRPDQLLVLLPGNFGSLVFARALHEAGKRGVVVAESDTAPYVCRRMGPRMRTCVSCCGGRAGVRSLAGSRLD